jgi:hypothetical protein
MYTRFILESGIFLFFFGENLFFFLAFLTSAFFRLFGDGGSGDGDAETSHSDSLEVGREDNSVSDSTSASDSDSDSEFDSESDFSVSSSSSTHAFRGIVLFLLDGDQFNTFFFFFLQTIKYCDEKSSIDQ